MRCHVIPSAGPSASLYVESWGDVDAYLKLLETLNLAELKEAAISHGLNALDNARVTKGPRLQQQQQQPQPGQPSICKGEYISPSAAASHAGGGHHPPAYRRGGIANFAGGGGATSPSSFCIGWCRVELQTGWVFP